MLGNAIKLGDQGSLNRLFFYQIDVLYECFMNRSAPVRSVDIHVVPQTWHLQHVLSQLNAHTSHSVHVWKLEEGAIEKAHELLGSHITGFNLVASEAAGSRLLHGLRDGRIARPGILQTTAPSARCSL